jgi:hypothetical protein
MRFSFFLGALCISAPVFSQSGPGVTDSRSAGLGGTSLTRSDVFAAFYNQAGLARLTHTSAGITCKSYFAGSGISSASAAVALPALKGVTALSASVTGNMLYSERKAGVSYARSFGDRLFAGAQFHYNQVCIADGYGSAHVFSAEAGIQARLSPLFLMGVHVLNPSRPRLAEYADERLPALMRAGFSFHPARMSFAIDLEKGPGTSRMLVRAGVEYSPAKGAYLRMGISSAAPFFTFGFGLEYASLRADVAASLHPRLGYSPQISLLHTF